MQPQHPEQLSPPGRGSQVTLVVNLPMSMSRFWICQFLRQLCFRTWIECDHASTVFNGAVGSYTFFQNCFYMSLHDIQHIPKGAV